MEIVKVVGIIFAAAVILILAYLYRESSRISGKATVEVGPLKAELEDQVQKNSMPEAAAAPTPGVRENGD